MTYPGYHGTFSYRRPKMRTSATEGIWKAPDATGSGIMPDQRTVDYYRARADLARATALRTADPRIAGLHAQLAEAYARVASGEQTIARLSNLAEVTYIIAEPDDGGSE
jgi:hypothetical protein